MNAEELLVRCPSCGSRDVRPSYPRGALDSIMHMFQMSPLRCRCCGRRFFKRLHRKPGEDDEEARHAAEERPPG